MGQLTVWTEETGEACKGYINTTSTIHHYWPEHYIYTWAGIYAV